MNRLKFPCPVPVCARVFRSEVALRFHVANEHGNGAADAARPIFQAARNEEAKVAKEDAEKRARRRLNAFYADGCPCGKSVAWHREQVAQSGGTA